MTRLGEDIKLLEKALSAYVDEYKEQSDIWKTIETKAQVSITLSGVVVSDK